MPDNLLPDEQALRDALAKSTQGEWRVEQTGHHIWLGVKKAHNKLDAIVSHADCEGYKDDSVRYVIENYESIALSHNLAPTLIDRLSALRERVAELQDINDTLRAENEDLRERDQTLVHKIATMNTDACELRERVADLESKHVPQP